MHRFRAPGSFVLVVGMHSLYCIFPTMVIPLAGWSFWNTAGQCYVLSVESEKCLSIEEHMNIRSFFCVFALLAVLISLTGCQSSTEVRMDNQANGSEVTVKPEQVLVIQLESNPTTGYGWEITQYDEAVLKTQGDAEYVSSDPGQKLVGAGGVEVFRFKPIVSGKTHLQLVYRRSWEVDVEPIQTFDLDVTVQ
jgi:inhibitor of cysteine peptidase